MAARFILMLVMAAGLIGCGAGTAPAVEPPAPVPTLPPGGAPALALCPDPAPPPVTDRDVRQPADLPEPAPRAPFRDPVFGACVVRVTDRAADPSPDAPTPGLKNEYSRVQSFNADGSLLVAMGTSGEWYLYDAASLQPLGPLPALTEPRWDPADPGLLFSIEETRLMAIPVRGGQPRTVHDFAADAPGAGVVWTRYEGSPSFDGRFWGLMAEDADWLTTALLIYDREADRVIAQRPTPDRPEIDSVTISPLGTYFLAYYDTYCEHGQLGTDAAPCGLMVYDRSLQNGRGLLRIAGHSDTALDADGREVLIYQDIDTDQVSLLDLASGAITPLFPIDFTYSPVGLHFSGRASAMPGWALVSTYSGAAPQSATWLDDVILAVELKASGRVIRLAHTHSRVDESQEHDYWAEPQASVNADFTRVVFTSNWGRSGTEEVDMYLLALPPAWLESAP